MADKILVVDDDADIRRSLERILLRSGYEVELAPDGFAAIESVRNQSFDLVVLDVMMPDMNGFTTCERLREIDPQMGIIFLSAKGDPFDKANGLRMGGDDYVSKPFDVDELLARVQAILRRMDDRSHDAAEEIVLGDLTIAPRNYTALKNGRAVNLSAKEFEILSCLATYPGQVFSRERIYRNVWGVDSLGDDRAIAVYVRKIREQIEDDPKHPEHLVTVWGVGYKLV